MSRRRTYAEIMEARRYPRKHVEAWLDDEMKLGDLCESFGCAGQHAQCFRDEIRRAVTDLVTRMDDALAGRRPD